jgi:hypothetical protein
MQYLTYKWKTILLIIIKYQLHISYNKGAIFKILIYYLLSGCTPSRGLVIDSSKEILVSLPVLVHF